MAKKPLCKLVIFDNGEIEAEEIDGVPVMIDPDITELADKKIKKPKKGKHAVVFETNPTWVFIGGRWIRIG